MKLGLVGNTIYYGGIWGIFAYLGWEIYNMGKNMPQIEEDHPVNEIFMRRRMEKRGKTLRDRPEVISRFETLSEDETQKVVEEVQPKVVVPPKKKDDEDGYM